MFVRQISKFNFSRLVFAKAPYVRSQTIQGVEFEIQTRVQKAEDNVHRLESR